MKRRRFIQSLASLSVAPAALAQAAPAAVQAPPPTTTSGSALELTDLDAVGGTLPGFFNAEEFSALQQLADLLQPGFNGLPGALEAGVPEFLDFLISQSPPERQTLYRAGLDRLHRQSVDRFGKAFAALDSPQADQLLAPLREPWTPAPSDDVLGRFLQTAKADVRTATVNSVERIQAQAESGGGRRQGLGMYWYTIE